MSDQTDEAPAGPTCSKCGAAPAGPGGILCPGCLAVIQAQRLPE
ncbi:hypothetical protein AB0J55_17690 [Amycolatopsis sp. NPDC049688]